MSKWKSAFKFYLRDLNANFWMNKCLSDTSTYCVVYWEERTMIGYLRQINS